MYIFAKQLGLNSLIFLLVLYIFNGCAELDEDSTEDNSVRIATELAGTDGEQSQMGETRDECNWMVATAEVCDGLDNDCDGQVDETFDDCCQDGEVRGCGVNAGICTVGEQICVDGTWNECNGINIIFEVCDGLDNDCDGQVDEQVNDCCQDGEVRGCGIDVGVCTAGEQSCVAGTWNECNGMNAVVEACDGLDNDCDGITDESVVNACGECGLVPTELCDGLDNDCDGSTDEGLLNTCGNCRPQPTEVCDNLDNDCDGSTDEGLLNTCGDCRPQPLEICDGIDNDCDGQTDEQIMGDVCVSGDGQCRSIGRLVCSNGQSVCDAILGAPSTEACDGIDNDCDGTIDEGSNGSIVCEELCDRLDNDNDGEIDENVQNRCGECGDLPLEVCDGNDNDCDGSIDEGVTNLCGTCGVLVEMCDGVDNDCDDRIDEALMTRPAEMCDGVDNDCDGMVDELLTRGQCVLGDGLCRVGGVERCFNGQFRCDGNPNLPSVERCDGFDNDCDGNTDENGNGGSICDEICNQVDDDGDNQIDEGLLNSCGTCGPSPTEQCDSIDNDCDGLIDEEPCTQLTIYRFNSSEGPLIHLYTDETAPPGAWNSEGAMMNIMADESSDTSPLYLCQNAFNSNYLLTEQADCEGYSRVRQLGYMTQQRGEAGVPLIKCQSNSSLYSLFTIIPTAECLEPVWSIDRTLGFVRSPLQP